ncbi:MAG: glycosyltransferase, partial [Anaerolineales bacterium]|nr:glycosyltransferase [Anaerolineales bacterium]
MKIGMVTACYKPVINGVTRMVDLYQQWLRQAGHEVTIFTLGEPDVVGDESNVIRSPAWAVGDTGYYAAARYTTEAQKRLQEMDIIHCHHLIMSVEFAHRYGRAPIIYTNHTRYDLYTAVYTRAVLPFLPENLIEKAMHTMWPKLTDVCDVIISPSASVKQVMRKFGVRRPIRVIENGVDLRPLLNPTHPRCKQTFGLQTEHVLAVYVGRLSPEKNLPTLLDEFMQAYQQRPELRLLLIGDGPLTNKLKQRVQTAGLDKAILFAGAIPYDEVGNYLAAADLFVTASVSEVHPLTVIEAMAAGLPIAGREAPGVSDSVTAAHSGLLVGEERGALAQ